MDLNQLRKELLSDMGYGGAQSASNSVDYNSIIEEKSKNYPDVPKDIIRAMVEKESSGNPRAEGPMTKYGTAKGLGQFIDSTAKQYIPDWKSPEDSYDPNRNIEGMFRYMNDLISQNSGDVKKAVGRYYGTGVDPAFNQSTDQYSDDVMKRAGWENTVAEGSEKTQDGALSMDALREGLKNAVQGTSELQWAGERQQLVQEQVQPEMGAIAPAQQDSAQAKILQPEAEKQPGLISDLGHSAAAGASNLVGSFYSAPGYAVGLLASGTNLLNKGINAVAGRKLLKTDFQTPEILLYQKAFDAAEFHSEKVGIKNDGKSLIDYAADGDLGKAAHYMGTWIAEQVPQQAMNAGMIMAGVPNLATLSLIGLETAGAKEAELKDKVKSGELTQEQASLAGALHGSAEAVFEKYGDIPVFTSLKKAFNKQAAKVGLEAAKETMQKTFKRVAGAFVDAAKKEVPSEVATQIAQDLTDKVTGVNPDITLEQMTKNVVDVAAGTLLMSGAPGAVTGFQQSQNIKQYQKGKEAEATEFKQKLAEDENYQRWMNQPDVSSVQKPTVEGVKEKVLEIEDAKQPKKKAKVTREQWRNLDNDAITDLIDKGVEFEGYEDLMKKYSDNLKKMDEGKEPKRNFEVKTPKDEDIKTEKTAVKKVGKAPGKVKKDAWIDVVKNVRPEYKEGDEGVKGEKTESWKNKEDTVKEVELTKAIKKDGDIGFVKETVKKEDIQKEPEGPEIIEATEEQLKKGKSIIEGVDGVSFQNSNPGIKGKNGKTGEVVDKKPTYEFKDEISGGNITLTEDQLNAEELNKKLAEKRASIKAESNEAIKKDVDSVKRDKAEKKEIDSINLDPTEKQIEAGNYSKAHIKRDGFDISIENPAGSVRSGKDQTGKEWSTKMRHDYGYVKGTKGADAYRENTGDQLDVFIKPNAPEGGDVFVVNQKDPKTGKFDEHKVMIGFKNKESAAKAYLSNYEKGWKGLKSITRMPMAQFKEWAYSDQTRYELKDTSIKTPDKPKAIGGSKTPNSTLIESLTERLKGEKIKNTREVLDHADKAYGGTVGEGKYGIRDAYDALETAMNKTIENTEISNDPKKAIQQLNDLQTKLPTQTVRTEGQVEKQQFSTPPSEAYLVAKVSGFKEGMTGLEPSAGDGNIATMMKVVSDKKGDVRVNEIDPKRRENLEVLGYSPTDADAEYLHSTLSEDVIPDVIVMNPPFSSTGGRLKAHDTGFGAEHVRQALLRLKDGGRLVAIVGRGMAFGRPKMQSWWNKVQDKYNVRANVGISGKEYAKYGTGFDNNIIVIDKTGKTEDITKVVVGEGLTVDQAYDRLEQLSMEDVYGNIKKYGKATSDNVAKEAPGRGVRGKTNNKDDSTVDVGRDGGLTTDSGKRTDGETVGTVDKPVGSTSDRAGGDTNQVDDAGSGDAGTTKDKPQANEKDSGKLGDDGSRRAEREQESVKSKKVDRVEEEGDNSVYAKYTVKKAKYKGAKPHPAKISEPVTMAAVDVPDATYQLSLPEKLVKSGELSDIQLEAVTYCCQAHEQRLPNGMRKEYLLGDGTGTGKARTLIGVMYENWLKGKKKFVYITKSKDLINQLQSDMKDMGVNIPVIPLDKYKKGEQISATEGILFGTYSTVSGDFSTKKDRYNQVKTWFGEQSDGVFVFDESHLMKNVSQTYNPKAGAVTGKLTDGSQRGQMGVQFKEDLPNARFVNASATAATEPVNLAYLTRLGLWGEGTPFNDFMSFYNVMSQGGVGAMELLARDMKASGSYISRSISYQGVEYDTITHNLSNSEVAQYDSIAEFWSEILTKIDTAAENARMKKEAQNIMKQFYASQQRFFLQLMMSFQVETMIKDAQKKLDAGKSVVISLFNTNEQQTDRKVTEAIANGIDIDSMDFSPKDSMKSLLESNFPIYQYEQYQDQDGKTRTRMVKDKAGNPLVNKENIEIRDALVEKIASFKIPDNPIDRIVDYFGVKNIAEVTGRKKRIEVVGGRKIYRDRAGKDIPKKRINQHELKQFMDGKKRVAIISGAAATGFDFHSSLRAKNQQQRVFYSLQQSWSADEQMQSFGRVHRSLQANEPQIALVKTNISSQKRLINTIQSRLASLGAMTKGERGSLSGGIFQAQDITDEYGRAALASMIGGLDNVILKKMNLLAKDGVSVKSSAMENVSGFLNRMMVLPVADQNSVFDQFYELYKKNVEIAVAKGTYDTGVEKIRGKNVRPAGDAIVLSKSDENSTKTEAVPIEYEEDVFKVSFEEALKKYRGEKIYVKNRRSGRGYIALRWADNDISVYGPRGIAAHYKDARELTGKYSKIEEGDARQLWMDVYSTIPDVETKKTYLVTGSVFPVYNKLFFDDNQKKKVKRADMQDGSSIIGIELDKRFLPRIKQNFGIGSDIYNSSPQEISDLISSGSIIEFDNGWQISTRKVMGESRVEINVGRAYVTNEFMENLGAFNEIIAYDKRFFIPTDPEKMVATINNIMKQSKPVRDRAAERRGSSMADPLSTSESAAAPMFYGSPKLIRATPDIVKIIPVEMVKNAPVGTKEKYAKASSRLGKQIASKPGKPKLGSDFLSSYDKFYAKWVNNNAPIETLEDMYNEDMDISKEEVRKIDILIAKVKGAAGMASQYTKDNLDPIIDSLGKDRSKKYTELGKYLVAKRSQWLYENKKNYVDMGISANDASTFVEFVESGAHPYSEEVQRAAEKIWVYGRNVLKIKQDHGIIDDQLMETLMVEPYYVPFYRNIEDKKIAGTIKKGEQYTTISKGIKKIRGSFTGKEIIDPIYNLMEHTTETMLNAARADVANHLIDMSERSTVIGDMFTKVEPKWVKMGTIEHRGEVDLMLRPKIEEMSNDLGIDVEYKTRLAVRISGKLKKVLGKYSGKIDILVGATEGTFAHELGHGIHDKISWYKNFINKNITELQRVAGTRYEGYDVTSNYVKYCNDTGEIAAEFIALYVTDRAKLGEIAPKALASFESKAKKDKTLNKLIDMKPSGVKGLKTVEQNNFVRDWHVPQDRDVISVLREGKIVSYKVPVEVADAVKNLHPTMFPAWFKVMFLPNRVLKRMAVSFNIDFIFPNIFRDQQEAAINARTIPGLDFAIGLADFLRDGKWSKGYLRSGGGMESVEAGTRGFATSAEKLKYGSNVAKYLDAEYWQRTGILKGGGKLLLSGLTSPFKAVEALAEASEMGTRVGTYRRKQVGVPKWLEWYAGKKKTSDEAMVIARQATLDFQRHGSWGRNANEVVPFLNAAIQGVDRMARTFKNDPKRAILSAMAYGYGPMIGMLLWNRDDELYKAISLQEKLNNWIIMNPDGTDYYKIPKGHIAKFIVNPAQIIMEKMFGTLAKSDGDAAMQILDDLSPVGVSSLPIALRMVIEPITNYDLYWNRVIETPAMKGISEAGERSDSRTSYAIKKIGKALNISPAMIQHEVGLLGAGTAKSALWVADNILVMAGIADGSIDASKFNVERGPVVRRFYGVIEDWKTDVDANIRDINKELAKMSKATNYQLKQRLRYSPQKVEKIKRDNNKKRKLLLDKRAELYKAKSEITKLLKNRED